MRAPLAAVLVAALLLAACGSSDTKSSSSSKPAGTSTPAEASGGGQTISLSADKSALKFTKTSLSAKAGKVTLSMANPSQVPHAVAVEGNGVDADGNVVGNGGTSKVTATLKAGTYTFYCPVDGHRASGMEGKLVVK